MNAHSMPARSPLGNLLRTAVIGVLATLVLMLCGPAAHADLHGVGPTTEQSCDFTDPCTTTCEVGTATGPTVGASSVGVVDLPAQVVTPHAEKQIPVLAPRGVWPRPPSLDALGISRT